MVIIYKALMMCKPTVKNSVALNMWYIFQNNIAALGRESSDL